MYFFFFFKVFRAFLKSTSQLVVLQLPILDSTCLKGKGGAGWSSPLTRVPASLLPGSHFVFRFPLLSSPLLGLAPSQTPPPLHSMTHFPVESRELRLPASVGPSKGNICRVTAKNKTKKTNNNRCGIKFWEKEKGDNIFICRGASFSGGCKSQEMARREVASPFVFSSIPPPPPTDYFCGICNSARLGH